MSLAIPQELKNLIPEFCAVPDPVIQDFLDFASLEVHEAVWGERAKFGEIYLAAHRMVMSGVGQTGGTGAGGSAGGPVQSIAVGDVSVSYGAGSSNAIFAQGLAPDLAGSKYGLQYSRLLRLLGGGLSVLNGT